MLNKLLEELITLLYMSLFSPQASGVPDTDLSVPWLTAMRREFEDAKSKFVASLLVEGKLDRVSLGYLADDLSVIFSAPGKTYSLHTEVWLYLAQVLELEKNQRHYLEQILIAWGKGYVSPRKTIMLPMFDPASCALIARREVPTGPTDSDLPFWRWFDVVVQPSIAGKEGEDLLSALDDVFGSLFLPCLPKTVATDNNSVLFMPLPNICQILTRAERIFPKKAMDIGQLRPWAALNFFTFGFHKFAFVTHRDKQSSIDGEITARYDALTSAIVAEAERLAKCNDKDFSNAHVSGAVESATALQSMTSEQMAELLKRSGMEKDPRTEPGAPDIPDDIGLGLPNEDQSAFFSSEADDPSAALGAALDGLGDGGPDGTPTETQTPETSEEPEADGTENSDLNVGSDDQTPPDNDAQPPAEASPSPVQDKNPQFRKLWGKLAIELDTAPNLESHLYKTAVNRMNDAIQNDPGDAVDPKVKSDMAYWCDQWLWQASTETTARLISALGLEKYLRA